MTFEILSKQLNTSVQSIQNLVQVLSAAFAEMEGGGGGGSSQDYSTEARVVGKWIDDTTDVYQKTFVFDNDITVAYNDWTDSGVDLDAGSYLFLNAFGVTSGGTAQGAILAYSDNGNLMLQTTRNSVNSNVKYLIATYIFTPAS